MNIYELTGQWIELQEMLESGDYDEQTIADTLEGLEGEIEAKADGYARIIRNMESDIEAFKKEAERLTEKKRRLENSVKRLKENLQMAMTLTGKTKFKTELFSFGIQKNGGALPVIIDIEEADLPQELKVVTERPDLKAIAEYIEANPDSGIAHFGERGESLRIR